MLWETSHKPGSGRYNAGMRESWAQRIARIVIEEEIRRIGYFCSCRIEARLRAYLSEDEQARFIAEPRAIFGEAKVATLEDALLYSIPGDMFVIGHQRGFTVRREATAKLLH